MIFLGLDDTDTLETPGTNKLALHLANILQPNYDTHWIVRHQLLVDPRVPCTNKNGCASILLEPTKSADLTELIECVRKIVIDWCPAGSDPGLCVTEVVPEEIMHWGRKTQTEFVQQSAAIRLAESLGIYLAPLGGTGDGVIGALAAVGLLATWNSGRIIYRRGQGSDAFQLSGYHPVAAIYNQGVDDIRSLATSQRITEGVVDLGKHLRPNLRNGRVVLYASRRDEDAAATWTAERVTA